MRFGNFSITFLIGKIIHKLQIATVRRSLIGHHVKLGCSTNVLDSSINDYSYIGDYSIVHNVSIGKYVSISNNCYIGTEAHPMNYVSTSPHLYPIAVHGHAQQNAITIIGNDVWIGAHSLIKSGVSIGNGAVIGMGSIVTHNVPPYEVWAGNPARKISTRFSADTIERMNESEWWAIPHNELVQFQSALGNPIEFLSEMKRTRNV